jgi:hypothetical protein
MLRTPYCQDNRLTDGGKVVSPKHRPRSLPQEHYLLLVLIFVTTLSKSQGLVRPERLRKLKKCIHHIKYRIRDLPACNVVVVPSQVRYRLPQVEWVFEAYK